MRYTVEEIENAYKKSSPKIRQILDSTWVADMCGDIGRDLNLRIDKIDALIRIVGLTLLNIISISDFIKVIEHELQVSSANATTITKKVDELIFQKVREIVISDEEDEKNDGLDFLEMKTNEAVIDLMDDIENRANDNISFKEKFNKVTVKKAEKRIVDPYREPID